MAAVFHRKSLCASLAGFSSLTLPIFFLISSLSAVAQPEVPDPSGAHDPKTRHDVVVFKNGDRLTGRLIIVVDGTVTFDSDILGKITLKMKQVKTLHTAKPFVMVRQGQRLSHSRPQTPVSYGEISVGDGHVTVGQQGASVTVPVGQAEYIVSRTTFEKTMYGSPGWREGWSGTVTVGAGLVEATQTSRSFTSTVSLTRTVPQVDWMAPRYRSSADFSATYGIATAPGEASTKTSIFHADLEHDQFFARRFFALAIASLGHNFSQGLDLQQIYGAGAGYTVLKSSRQELDLKADLHYQGQSFSAAPGVTPPVMTPTRHLIGMDFGDNYTRKLFQGISVEQTLMAIPTFNYLRAYSAQGTASMLFPISKNFSFHLGARADFLNDPGFGSKKNSMQFSAGLGYTLQ